MIYPTLSEKPDQKSYSVEKEDPAISNEMEGGYVTSRPRFLRNPRKTFRFSYKALPEKDYLQLEEFWDQVRGRSVIFQYKDWHDGVIYDVRFKTRFKAKFVGAGDTRWWDISNIVLEEA